MPNKIEMIPADKALVYLLGCAVNGLAPQRDVLCAMNWQEVYRLSRCHTVTAAACMAVERGLAADEPVALDEAQKATLTHWQNAKYQAIRKNMLLDADRAALCRYCESIGCWYMPLKGAVLKELYPRAGMRQMADNDILFDGTFQQTICDWFVARGYKAESVGRGNHDVYRKEPIYNFEMHTALFNDAYHPEWAAYYADVGNRLLPAAHGHYGRQFREEDFYLYITLHEYKHFSGGGTGVRNLLDRYVFCSKKADALDWTYIRGELQTLGIAEYEAQARAMSEVLFTDPTAFLHAQLSDENAALLAYYFGSGTYGTIQNNVKHKVAKLETQSGGNSARAKGIYMLHRIFPSQKIMMGGYPKLARHKVLLPVCYIHRLIMRAVKRRKAIQNEMKIVMKL